MNHRVKGYLKMILALAVAAVVDFVSLVGIGEKKTGSECVMTEGRPISDVPKYAVALQYLGCSSQRKGVYNVVVESGFIYLYNPCIEQHFGHR